MLEAQNIDIQVKTQLHLNSTTFKLWTQPNHQKSKYLRACLFARTEFQRKYIPRKWLNFRQKKVTIISKWAINNFPFGGKSIPSHQTCHLVNQNLGKLLNNYSQGGLNPC